MHTPTYILLTLHTLVHSTHTHSHSVRLSTGCPHLDSFLNGGLPVPALNEVAGTSAAGKTQLCLQLCLTVQLPRQEGGLDGGTCMYRLYIYI